MTHIKVKIIFFMSMVVMLTALLTSGVGIFLVTQVYMKELYQSSLHTVKQISQNTDNVVTTVENSIKLIFSSSDTVQLLEKVDFSKQDGDVFEAYRTLDSQLSQFKSQFPPFDSLIVFNNRGGCYGYRYYSGGEALQSAPWYWDLDGADKPAACSWKGVYPTGNRYFIAGSGREEENFVVTQQLINRENLRVIGTVAVFLDKRVFSDIFADIEEGSGERVVILDDGWNPVEGLEAAERQELADVCADAKFRERESGNLVGGSGKGRYLATYVKSPVTGWTAVKFSPLHAMTQKIMGSVAAAAFIGAGLLAAAGCAIFFWASRFSKAIGSVANAMEEVSRHNLDVHLPQERKDEIGMICRGFNSMVGSIRSLLAEVVEQEQSKQKAEIRAMHYRIKPHFLYNTLASIRMLAIREGNENIANMLTVLNRLLRSTINIQDHVHSLREELASLDDYLAIEQMRYNNRLTVAYHIPEALLPLKIPNMLLQPVVENAIEHAFGERIYSGDAACRIEISASIQGEDLLLEVRDNGAGLSELEMNEILKGTEEGDGDHIGLRNINGRLKMLFGGSCGIEIKSEKGRYTSVILRLKAQAESWKGG